MPMWTVENLEFDEDAVLRGQGADPKVIRQRSPKIVEMSQQALKDGVSYLSPQVWYQKLKVDAVRHEQVVLENGKKLTGPLIVNHLGPAEYVVVLLCTVGGSIDEYISNLMQEDILYGLAMDGVGSAAVEALANSACRFFEDQATADGNQSSIPLSPGMVDWEVERGQPEIFDILTDDQSEVQLSSSWIMTPRKSLTMVIGFGPEMKLAGRTCDFCAMNETCRYKDHYEPVEIPS